MRLAPMSCAEGEGGLGPNLAGTNEGTIVGPLDTATGPEGDMTALDAARQA